MKRVLVLAVMALAIAPGAPAKAPPIGFRACGPLSCVPFSQADAEPLAINLFFGAASLLKAAPPPASFYALHWSWQENGPVYTAYYVPANGAVYLLSPSTGGPFATKRGWLALDAAAQTAMGRVTPTLAPFTATLPPRVTVAGKVVRDATGYESLWRIGKPMLILDSPDVSWLPIRIVTRVESPWSGRVWLARRAPLLLRDLEVFRISRALAARIRHRQPLR
jgi:hypothetical protein